MPGERWGAGAQHTEGMFPSQRLLQPLGHSPKWLQTPQPCRGPLSSPALPCLGSAPPPLCPAPHAMPMPWPLAEPSDAAALPCDAMFFGAGERLCYASPPIPASPEGAEARLESHSIAWVLRERVLQPEWPPARQTLWDSVWLSRAEVGEGGALPEAQTVSPFVNAAVSLPNCLFFIKP